MLIQLHVSNFKSLGEVTLPLADELTLLVGTNASGKSNALEALELLSWMARGLRLGDLSVAMREGQLSLRGKVEDLTRAESDDPCIKLGCHLRGGRRIDLDLQLVLQVHEGRLRVVEETLRSTDLRPSVPLYRVSEPAGPYGSDLSVQYNNFARGGKKPTIQAVDQQPVFTQLTTPTRFHSGNRKSQRVIPEATTRLQDTLARILFLDPDPRAMRGYAFLDEARLAGNGANLSGILHHLTEEGGERETVLAFIRDLPQQDIDALTYLRGPRGEVMVQLIETFGGLERACEAALLSDGTLRVLAVAAALLSVEERSLVVIEEIDNGVHPSRARSLLKNIREVAKRRNLRVLITTHNPALLDALPEEAVPHVVTCFRDQQGLSRLLRLEELWRYPQLVARGPLGHLAVSGVLERFLTESLDAPQTQPESLDWLNDILGGEE